MLRKRKQLDSNLLDLLECIVGLEPSYVVYVWYGFGEIFFVYVSILILLRMLMLYIFRTGSSLNIPSAIPGTDFDFTYVNDMKRNN